MNRKSFFRKAGALSLLPFFKYVDSYASDIGQQKANLQILTCNIRVALEEDELNGVGWSSRKEGCLKIIKGQKPDIIGFQEVLRTQFVDLREGLKDFHGLNFDGPEMDAHKDGYHGIAKNPIFFSKKRFELRAAGSYWLSETPLIAGSKSWGTARARNMSWVRLYDRTTRKEFRFLNLHLDHVSNEAKLAQVQLVLDEADQYQTDFPQIFVGDFNANAQSKIVQNVLSAGWRDSYAEANGDQDPGPTVHVFLGPNDPKKDVRKKIDFIFLKGAIATSTSTVIKDAYKGVYPSDHYFVEAVLELI